MVRALYLKTISHHSRHHKLFNIDMFGDGFEKIAISAKLLRRAAKAAKIKGDQNNSIFIGSTNSSGQRIPDSMAQDWNSSRPTRLRNMFADKKYAQSEKFKNAAKEKAKRARKPRALSKKTLGIIKAFSSE